MTTTYDKPLPPVDDPLVKPHYDALKEHRFVLQRCTSCSAYRWPSSPVCDECLQPGTEWVEAPTGGKIWSFVVYDRPYRREFKDDIPYNVAMIELDAGPRMIASIANASPEEIEIGARVEAVYDDITDDVTLVRFELTS